MSNIRDIRYIDRDFASIKNQLIEFSKNYYPDTYNDFSPSSPGIMFMEMVAYVSDILSFYQDKQLQETFIQYSKDPKNVYNLAYMLGYRPKNITAAEVELDVFQIVDSSPTDPFQPNWSQASIVLENATIKSTNSNTTFLTKAPVDFSFSSSFDPTFVEVQTVNSSNEPESFILTKKVKAFSGEVKTLTKQVLTATKFLTITLEDTNIIEILDIVDDNGSGDTWYEVPYLGQETVFSEVRNSNADSNRVYNSLNLIKTDKRFVTRFDPTGKLSIQFGAGTFPSPDSTLLPSLENVGLNTSTGVTRLDHAYDPSNFLYSRTYGLAPSNTTLRIRYIVGGGLQSNVPANTLTQIQNATIINGTVDTIGVTNPLQATGGSTGDTVQEIRQNAVRKFNEQGRAVTLQDYVVRSYSLPARLGGIAKVFSTQEQSPEESTSIYTVNPFSISLYTLSYDSNGKLTNTTSTLKDNLKKYLSQYIMITDTVKIKDAYIVNIGIEYEIVIYPNQPSSTILLECNNKLAEYFKISNRNINQPIVLSELYLLLDKVKGLQSAENIKIVNKVGGIYSPFSYDIQSATKKNVIYPSLDTCIFEIKYPEIDIKGRVTTI